MRIRICGISYVKPYNISCFFFVVFGFEIGMVVSWDFLGEGGSAWGLSGQDSGQGCSTSNYKSYKGYEGYKGAVVGAVVGAVP